MFKKMNAFQEDYLKDPYPVMSYIIFNIYSKYSRKIDEFFFLYHDSWGSTKFEVFNNEMDLIPILVADTERVPRHQERFRERHERGILPRPTAPPRTS